MQMDHHQDCESIPDQLEVPLHPTKYSFKCIYAGCNAEYNLTSDLYSHIRTHQEYKSNPGQCTHCRCAFRKSMSSLVYHIRTHSSEKPYICPLDDCSYQSAIKSGLKGHLLSKRHSDVMSLDLLNKILHFDTENGKEETSLVPRKKKRRRATMPVDYSTDKFFNLPPQSTIRHSFSGYPQNYYGMGMGMGMGLYYHPSGMYYQSINPQTIPFQVQNVPPPTFNAINNNDYSQDATPPALSIPNNDDVNTNTQMMIDDDIDIVHDSSSSTTHDPKESEQDWAFKDYQ